MEGNSPSHKLQLPSQESTLSYRKPMTEAEMLEDLSNEILDDAMQDLILQDILVDIIKNNEVSKIADNKFADEKLADHFAEGLMREVAIQMIREEIARPALQVSDTEKKALSNALQSSLLDFKAIEQLTREVVKESVN